MAQALQPDDRIAHYRVIRALGAGGMGEVYLARDSTLDRSVALKVLPQMGQDDDRVKRFILEAKSASSLNHPHIITIYEIGNEPLQRDGVAGDHVQYMAMELVAGDTLAELIHHPEHRADLKTLLGYLAQAADGLAKAHASGIVHRDLKPGNIMVSKDGYAKILDFGLAKLVEKEATPADATIAAATRPALTVEGMIVGTVGYMAPEQILGRPVDARSDIFSFGCILYEAITRQRPFSGGSQFESLQRIIHENPAPIEAAVPDAPAELRVLVGRCLAKLPDQRVQSMKDVSSELRRVANAYESLARSGANVDATVYYAPVPSGAIQPPPGSAAAYPSTAAMPQMPSTVILAPPAAKKLPIAAIAGGGVLALAIVGFAVWKFVLGSGGGLSQEAISRMQVTQILSNENLFRTAVAPLGKYAAYVTTTSAQRPNGTSFQAFALKSRQISSGAEVVIVKDSENPIIGLSFTPDGDTLYYVAQDPANNHYFNLFRVPSIGGVEPVEVLKNVDTEITCGDKDCKQFAFMRGDPSNEDQTSLMIYDTATKQERSVASVKSQADVPIDKPRWSPDGKRIAIVYPKNPPKVVVIDVASGQEKTIGKWDVANIDSVAWMGDDGMIVSAGNVNANQLWHLTYPGGDQQQLTHDTYHYTDVSTSTDGTTITARRQFRAVQTWHVPVAGTRDDMKQAPIGASGPENISYLAAAEDGTIVFVAPKDAYATLWVATNGTRKPLLSDPLTVFAHSFMRGQNATAFTGFGAGYVPHVYRVSIDGSQLKQLTTGTGESLVAVSPDGKSLYYNTTDTPRTLVSMASDGSSPKPIVTDLADTRAGAVVFSQDARLLSYDRIVPGKVTTTERVALPVGGGQPVAKLQPAPRTTDYHFNPDGTLYTYIDQQKAIMSIPIGGGTPTRLLELTDQRIDIHRWMDAKTIVLSARSLAPDKPQSTNLWRWTAGNAAPAALTGFPSGIIFQLFSSIDNKTLYFTQGALNRDIVKISGLK